jgi:hypothetical protein
MPARYWSVTSALIAGIGLSWVSKLLYILWIPAGIPESILLSLVLLFCNGGALWSVVASVRFVVGEQVLRRERFEFFRLLQASALVALILSIAHILPYLPDGVALAAREAQYRAVVPYLVMMGIYGASVLFLTLVRVVPIAVATRLAGPSLGGLLSAVPLAFVWSLADFLLLFLFPFAYWGALPPPVPLAPQVAVELLGSTRSAKPLVKAVLVNPRVSDSQREFTFLKGEEGQREFAKKLADAWSSARHLPLRAGDQLLFVLPETTLFLEPSGLRALFLALRERLGEKMPEVNIGLLIGSQFGGVNSVMWAGEQVDTRWPLAGVVKLKERSGRVPFFERSTLGISVRGEREEEQTAVSFDDWIPEEELAKLPSFLLPRYQLICYEALDPRRWELSSPRVVFTNHNLFAKYRLMSRTYDANLRLMASVFVAPLVLVGNDGATGVHSWMPLRLLQSDAQHRVEVELLEFGVE